MYKVYVKLKFKSRKIQTNSKTIKRMILKASTCRYKSKLKKQRYGTSVLMGVIVDAEALFMQRF